MKTLKHTRILSKVARLSGFGIFLSLLCWLGEMPPAMAQQQMHYTQYMVNPYVLNPAAGGTMADVDIKVGYRRQWSGFPGAPRAKYVSGHSPFKVKRKPGGPSGDNVPFHALGGFVYQDEAGPIKKTSASFSYSYNIPLSKNLRMALGLFGGILDLRLDQGALRFDQEGEVLAANNRTLPDASVGLWLHNPYFFLGASVNQLFYNEVNFIQEESQKDQQSHLAYHAYLMNGYNIPLDAVRGKEGKHSYYFVPSFVVKYAGKGTLPSWDLNAKIKKHEVAWVGASYRNQDALALLLGLNLLKTYNSALELSYAYDFTLSKINAFSSGSHEIVLGYRFHGKGKVLCPDNFW